MSRWNPGKVFFPCFYGKDNHSGFQSPEMQGSPLGRGLNVCLVTQKMLYRDGKEGHWEGGCGCQRNIY